MRMRYPALIDGERGANGIVFPDIDGIAAMGETLDEVILNGPRCYRSMP